MCPRLDYPQGGFDYLLRMSTPCLREMEVVAIERAKLGVLQVKRVAPRRNDDVLSSLGCMGENAGKAVEYGLADLYCIVPPPAGDEVLDDVVAEIRGEHECILMSIADEDVIGRGACQRIAVGRAEDRLARTRCYRVAGAVDLLGFERMYGVGKLIRGEAPRTVGSPGH